MSLDKEVKNVILDVDTGPDDAWAILLMLWAEKQGLVKIKAITIVNGNTTIENGTKNTLRVLETAGRLDIPVFKGCPEPLIVHSTEPQKPPFGDGFGNVEFESDPDLSIIQEKHAVKAIYDIIKSHEGKIHLICVGPLTNLAMLFKMYPGISESLSSLWIMGGTRYGMGNATTTAEFNFFIDPEAAFISLQNAKCPVYMLPLETTKLTEPIISLEWRFTKISEHKNRITRLMDPVEKSCFAFWNAKNWWVFDAVLAACFIDPKCMTKVSDFHVTIELNGLSTRGQVVIDHRKKTPSNVMIIEEYDVEIFKNIALETVKKLA